MDTASPGVRQALLLLEELARCPDGGMTLTELGDRLGLPKNSVLRIGRTLQAAGYVERHPETLRFRLTGKLLSLAQPRRDGRTLSECAIPEMRALRDACRETVQLGVPSGEGGVIVEVLDGLHPLRIAVDIGVRYPLHNNAPGKVHLAWLPTAERDAVIDRLELVASTQRTITDRAALRAECARVAAHGFSTDHAEADEGIHCVAAPVFDRHRRCVAALWVSGPSRRMPKDGFPALAAQVRRASAAVTEKFCR
jgi:DNA-binding IclR family transcriptional regulator